MHTLVNTPLQHHDVITPVLKGNLIQLRWKTSIVSELNLFPHVAAKEETKTRRKNTKPSRVYIERSKLIHTNVYYIQSLREFG